MDWCDRRVLVVIAHPDDEVLGCGATLAHISRLGAHATVLLPTRRIDQRGVREWSNLLAAFDKSCLQLGVTPALTPSLLDETRAESDVHELHDAILPFVEDAEVIFTHHPGDVHQTHRGISRAVEIATRPFRRFREVLLCEVPTSTDQGFMPTFVPQTYMVLDDADVDAATRALAHYPTEFAPGRRPEDLEWRYRLRGAEIGAPYAQAFQPTRRVL